MEKDPNPMPEFVLFPRLERAARAVGKLFMHITAAPDCHSNHYRAPLDGQEYRPSPTLIEDPRLPGFDADGNYHCHLNGYAEVADSLVNPAEA